MTSLSRSRRTEGGWVVVLTKGTSYVERLGPAEQRGIARHREYLSGLVTNGVVLLAGPLFEDDQRTRVCGLLYLVHAESLGREARSVTKKAPKPDHDDV